MNRIYLDDLPKRGKSIDWNKCVGLKVNFVYGEQRGNIEILSYNNSRLQIKYENTEKSMHVAKFKRCQLGRLLGKFNPSHIYDIGDTIDSVSSGKLKIVQKFKNEKNVKYYTYLCLLCGNTDKIMEGSIRRGCGCNACCKSPRRIIKGINDIHTVDSKLGMLLWNHDDGYKHAVMSGKYLDFKCPECNLKIENKKVCDINIQGLSCPNCSDNITYPEKFMYNLLKLAGVDFDFQISFKWSNAKIYDFFIPSANCIIETHGEQHYYQSARGQRTLKEEQENDRLKKEMASYNNIKNYITIDCSKSEMNFIKDNTLRSELVSHIDLSKIDWDICHELSLKSLVKIACEHFNSGKYTAENVAKIMKLSKQTTIKYLKKGSSLGWCTYDAIKESKKGSSKAGKKNRKPIVQLALNGDYMEEYTSATQAAEKNNISVENISSVCAGRRKTTGGFKWIYKDDYERQTL